MAEHTTETLEELLESLQKRNASDLAEDIKTVIARGATRETEAAAGRVKELTQTPLEPEEAYRVAIEMLIASLEPLLMKKEIHRELSMKSNLDVEIDWQRDFIEKSSITPEVQIGEALPQIETQELDAFEADLKSLVTLLEED